jgi:hypothetical protein
VVEPVTVDPARPRYREFLAQGQRKCSRLRIVEYRGQNVSVELGLHLLARPGRRWPSPEVVEWMRWMRIVVEVCDGFLNAVDSGGSTDVGGRWFRTCR